MAVPFGLHAQGGRAAQGGAPQAPAQPTVPIVGIAQVTFKSSDLVTTLAITGLSVALHLAEAGAKPLVVEREGVAAGASGVQPGGVRQQWSTPLNCRASYCRARGLPEPDLESSARSTRSAA